MLDDAVFITNYALGLDEIKKICDISLNNLGDFNDYERCEVEAEGYLSCGAFVAKHASISLYKKDGTILHGSEIGEICNLELEFEDYIVDCLGEKYIREYLFEQVISDYKYLLY